MFELMDAQEKARKAALLLAHERYSAQYAPFVKNAARLSYVTAQVERMISEVCNTTGADYDYVHDNFMRHLAETLPVLTNPGNAKREDIATEGESVPGKLNKPLDLGDIKHTDKMQRGEVEGAGLEEALKPDARVDIRERESSMESAAHKVISTLKQAMTSRDYRLIAGILAQNGADIDLVNSFADQLSITNPAFDRERFVAAATGSPMSGRDAPGYKPYAHVTCFRCGTNQLDAEYAKVSSVCPSCTHELLKLAGPQFDPRGFAAQPADPNQTERCLLCGWTGPWSELQEHMQTTHNVQPQQPGQAQQPSVYQGSKEADAPTVPATTTDQAVVPPVDQTPADNFDDTIQDLANRAAARRFSMPTDEQVHSIVSQLGLDETQVRQNLHGIALFGNYVGKDGQITDNPTPPQGYEEVSVPGIGGQVDSHEALIPTDLVVSKVADDMNMQPNLAYQMIRDRYGSDLPDKYHASLSGEVHYYLPTELAGNQQQAPQDQQPQPTDPNVGPAASPAPVARVVGLDR